MYYLMWGKIEKNYLLEHTIAAIPTYLPNPHYDNVWVDALVMFLYPIHKLYQQ